MKNRSVSICTGGGGPAEPVLQLDLCDWTTRNIRVKAEPVASAPLVLRLALNATARACAEERGLPRRALDSTQGKPCSVALLGLAFTMAEILLSLTIIGVVAAITLPSLTGNINERTWNTQRKALYARFSQAIPLMGAINGYADGETFISAGLNKVLKINNVCDSEHLEDCGIPSKITTLNAGIYSVPSPFTLQELNEKFVSYSDSFGSYDQSDVEAVGFETQGGESIMLFYMPNCQAEMGETSDHFVQPKICVNMIYDLNGNKGPNTIGKDMGVMSVLYPSDSNVVMPYPNINDAASGVSHADALKICKQQDDEYRLPTRDELASLFINQNILGIPLTSSWYWTSSVSSSLKAWDQSMVSGRRRTRPKTETAQKVKCVKRF